MSSFVHEADATGIPTTALAAKNGEDYWAAARTDTASGLAPDLGEVGLTGTTAATDEVIGQFMHSGFDKKTARIRTKGLLFLRAKVAFAASMLKKGVVSSDTAGEIQAAASVGDGFGKILGGATITIDGVARHIYKVYV